MPKINLMVDVSDIFSEIEDDILVDELESRGYVIYIDGDYSDKTELENVKDMVFDLRTSYLCDNYSVFSQNLKKLFEKVCDKSI